MQLLKIHENSPLHIVAYTLCVLHDHDIVQTEEREYLERIAEDQKIMERLTNKRGLLIKKREECMRKIRELGSLPADTNTKYQNFSLKEVSYCVYAVTAEGEG